MNQNNIVPLALEALKQNNFAEARRQIVLFGARNSMLPVHYLIKGLAEVALLDWAAAAQTFGQATKAFDDQPQLWFNLGVAQEKLGQTTAAIQSYEASIALKPTGEACGNLSNLYRQVGRYLEAEASATYACRFEPTQFQALNSLGLALGKQGKFAEAGQAFEQARAIHPADANLIANQANLAVDQLDFDKAWPLFAEARRVNDQPIIRRDEGMARLLAGDYARGWTLFGARLDVARALRTHPTCPLYRGEDLTGKKLLLIAEQGFGDTIMFCRYGKFFAAQGAELIWAVQKPLHRLLTANLPGQVFAEGDALPTADYYLPLMSAPLALQKLEPFGDVYLKATAEKTQLPSGAGTKPKIGIVWSGSKTHERDHERSIKFGAFLPLFEKINGDFYALTPDHPTDMPASLIWLDHLIKDFADTAALLMQLDALITVDTATAHLAGALGVKTYLLLPKCPDWRWGVSGATTPWYPGMTLLRQPRYGDWPTVINNLIDRLA